MNKIIAIIPARGGSKGIKNKNIREVAGLPLIVHSIQHAKNAVRVDDVYVSTDCDDIATVAREAGAKVIARKPKLGGDSASSESALIDALEQIQAHENYIPELVVFLQCTSPIRKNDDIDKAIKQLIDESADSLLSVVDNHRFLWEIVNNEPRSINYDFRSRQRRQDLNPQYCENGSIYIFKPENLQRYNNRLSGKVVLFHMNPETAFEIDSPLDLNIVESIMKLIDPSW